MRRARAMAGLGGLVLLGSLWLPWYTAGGDSGDAWQAFDGLDVTLAALGLIAIGGAAVSFALRVWTLWTTVSLSGALATIAISARILYPPDNSGDLDPTVGPFVGLAGAVVVLVSLSAAKRGWTDESTGS